MSNQTIQFSAAKYISQDAHTYDVSSTNLLSLSTGPNEVASLVNDIAQRIFQIKAGEPFCINIKRNLITISMLDQNGGVTGTHKLEKTSGTSWEKTSQGKSESIPDDSLETNAAIIIKRVKSLSLQCQTFQAAASPSSLPQTTSQNISYDSDSVDPVSVNYQSGGNAALPMISNPDSVSLSSLDQNERTSESHSKLGEMSTMVTKQARRIRTLKRQLKLPRQEDLKLIRNLIKQKKRLSLMVSQLKEESHQDKLNIQSLEHEISQAQSKINSITERVSNIQSNELEALLEQAAQI